MYKRRLNSKLKKQTGIFISGCSYENENKSHETGVRLPKGSLKTTNNVLGARNTICRSRSIKTT